MIYDHLRMVMPDLEDLLDTPTVFDPEHEDYSDEDPVDLEKQQRVSTLLSMMK